MKNCLECNINFIPDKNHPFQKFCSKKCRELNIEKNNKCIDCGKKLNSHAKYAKTERCLSCAGKLRKGFYKKGHIPWNKDKCHYFLLGKKPSKQCIKAAIEANKNRIITEETREKMKQKKLGIKQSIQHKQNISIGNIGKKRSTIMRLKYSLSKLGNKNPNYKNGKSTELYTQDFNKLLKKEIKIRDNYTCQNCGMTEDKHNLVYNQVLHVHHIDYNKKNCSKENLITLCKRCNLKANLNRLYWQKYFLTKQGEN